MGVRLRAEKARGRAADGLTSSGDMRQQVQLHFDTAEEAVAYCERHGIAYQVFEATPSARRVISYSDNFSFKRSEPWTH
jgi:hypothetical protein